MKINSRFLAIALPVSVAAFFLTRVIWPDVPGMPMPDASLIPHFIFVLAVECLGFGIGVAFAILAWSRVNQTEGALPLATFFSIVWLLVSWWPHDNLHRITGMEFSGLIKIEYGFHVTLVIAGCIVAQYFLRQLSKPAAQ